MNKKFFLTVLFLIPLLNFAQKDSDLINRYDSKGRRHGAWEKYYESGRIRYKGKFYKGKEVGDFYFYENKIVNNYPTIKKFFIKGTDIADVIFYNTYGKIKSDGQMQGRIRFGIWRYYDNKGGMILSETYDQKGILHGKTTYFFADGKRAEEKFYKHGKLDGVSVRYSKEGVKLHEMSYVDGLLHGRCTFYETNGNPKESGLYYRDYKVGRWDFYLDGEYMGYKEPNKQRDKPDDEHILASIEGKKDKKVEYAKLTDDEILKNISSKMDEQIKEVKRLDDAQILKNIKGKNRNKKKSKVVKLSDDEILRNIQGKSKDKKPARKYKKLSDEEILKNIQKSKAPKEDSKVKKLSDEEILKNIQLKNKGLQKEEPKVKKLSDEEILENIKNKNKIKK